MTSAEFIHLATMVCHLSFAPGVTPERLADYAWAESRLNPEAISAPNRDGSRDRGLLQINDQHLRRFHQTKQSIMQPCVNIAVGGAILAESDRMAACAWNTGNVRCRNGYDARIVAAHARVVQAASPPSPPSARPVRRPIPAASVYARRRSSARQFVYLSER